MKSLSNHYYLVALLFLTLSCSENQPEPIVEKEKPVKKVAETDTIEQPSTLIVDGIGYNLHKIDRYETYIKRYATIQGLDWRLIVAIILKESSFNEQAVSRVGAKGLMQIMPLTKNELSERLDIEYIYERPEENIKAGIYHLSEQFQFFTEITDSTDLLKVALASYNCGAGRLIDAIKLASVAQENPTGWESVKWGLERLQKKNYKLHLAVWADGVPRHGYFNNPIETTTYVDRIWLIYEALQAILAE